MSTSNDLIVYWEKMSAYLRGKIDKKIKTHIMEHNLLPSYNIAVKTAGLFSSDLDEDHVTALHGFWLLWYDDARNEFCFPEELVKKDEPIIFGEKITEKDNSEKIKIEIWKDNAKERFIKTAVEKGYNLESGAGSAGLGVRINKGVCLRDTIRDTRGAVAYEDLLSSNYSFMGIPIYRGADSDQSAAIADKGKPIVLFCFFFPARGAWHDDDSSCCVCPSSPRDTCLFNEIEDFCKTEVKPIVETIYELLELRAYQEKVSNLSKLDMSGKFREEVLKNFITSSPSKDGKKKRDLLGFKTALLLEKASSGDSVLATNMFEDLKELGSYHLESNYNSLEYDDIFKHIKDQWPDTNGADINKVKLPLGEGNETVNVTIQYVSSSKISEDIFTWFQEQYIHLLAVKSPWPPYPFECADQNDNKIDKAIELIKWRELVLGKTCQAIVDFMTGYASFAEDINHLLNQGIDTKLSVPPPNIDSSIKAKIAFATTIERWNANILTDNKRLKYEIDTLPHTRTTIFRLLTALESADLLPQKTHEISVLTNNSHIDHDYIKSEAGISEKLIIDCGSFTALGHNKLLSSWCDEECLHKIDSVSIKRENDGHLVVTIGSNSFRVDKLKDEIERNAKKIALGFSKEPVHTLNEISEPREIESNDLPYKNYNTLYKLLSKIGDTESGKELLPCISVVAGKWSATWAGSESSDIIQEFEESIHSTEDWDDKLLLIHEDALKVGVNSYITAPLWIDGVLHGLLMLGSPQREYDTAKRIRYSEQQLKAVRTICDYLKLAISLEQKNKQAIEEKSRAEQFQHLAGIEPDIRKLIDDVVRMKYAAERVARQIAPAQHGVFAYDSETIKLFQPGKIYTVDLTTGGHQQLGDYWQLTLNKELSIKDKSKHLVAEQNKIINWPPEASFRIREGRHSGESQLNINSVHDPVKIDFKRWNLTYAPLFFLIGKSRYNGLMAAFGTYFTDKAENIGAQLLFTAAKQIFHRLHFPGEGSSKVYHNQLLAALVVPPCPLTLCQNSHSSTEVKSYNELIEYIKRNNDITALNWCIHDKVINFITYLNQLCYELNDDSMVKLMATKLSWTDNSCEINLIGTNYSKFDPKKIHREELSTDKFDSASEHGLTRAIISIEKCVQTYLSTNEHSYFYYKMCTYTRNSKDINDCIMFVIKLKA